MNRKATEVNRRNFKKMMLHSLPHHWHYNCLIVAQVKIASLDCYEAEKEYLNFFYTNPLWGAMGVPHL